MGPSKCTVRPATRSDAAAIARVQNEAFASFGNPRLRPGAAQDPEGFMQWLVSRNESIMAGGEGTMAWHIALLPDSNEIAAIARWEWVDDALAAVQEPVTSVPFGGPEQVAFFNDLDVIHRRIMQNKPHYCLHILATLPAHQGKGAASSLLRHLTAMADAQKVPVYLEATPMALEIYKRFGWRETGEFLQAPIGLAANVDPQPVVTMMVREPQESDCLNQSPSLFAAF